MIWDVTAPGSVATFVKQTFEGCFKGPDGILALNGFNAINDIGRTVVCRNLSQAKQDYPAFKHEGRGHDDLIVTLRIPFRNDERARSIWRAIGETLQMCQDSPFIRIVILDKPCRTLKHLWTGRFRLRTTSFEEHGEFSIAEFSTLLAYNDEKAMELMQKDLDAEWERTKDRLSEKKDRDFENIWVGHATPQPT